MNKQQAIQSAKESSFNYIASYRSATDHVYCAFACKMDAIRWVNFNRDYMYPGSDKIESVSWTE